MSKKMRYLLFILVLMVPLVLAACGGDDDDKKDDGGKVELNQTFTSDYGVTVKYPEGWTAADVSGQVMLANSAEVMESMQNEAVSSAAPEKGQVGLVVMALPLEQMGMPADTSIDTIFEMMVSGMTGEGMTTDGDTESVKVGDADARKLKVKDSESDADGTVLAFMDSDSAFVMVIALTASGERSQHDDVVMKIAESITWSAPAAE